jgi:hypothetical protein
MGTVKTQVTKCLLKTFRLRCQLEYSFLTHIFGMFPEVSVVSVMNKGKTSTEYKGNRVEMSGQMRFQLDNSGLLFVIDVRLLA